MGSAQTFFMFPISGVGTHTCFVEVSKTRCPPGGAWREDHSLVKKVERT
jgi:hypothetical protein